LHRQRSQPHLDQLRQCESLRLKKEIPCLQQRQGVEGGYSSPVARAARGVLAFERLVLNPRPRQCCTSGQVCANLANLSLGSLWGIPFCKAQAKPRPIAAVPQVTKDCLCSHTGMRLICWTTRLIPAIQQGRARWICGQCSRRKCCKIYQGQGQACKGA
jgi:hypothetical protein